MRVLDADEYRIPARPTLYRGTRMRSRLEARFAGLLDGLGADWAYEPICFAGRGGQWLPDFMVGGYLYVEVKPKAGPWLNAAGLQRWAELLWQSRPAASVLLWTPEEWALALHWASDPVVRSWPGSGVRHAYGLHVAGGFDSPTERGWPWQS